MRSFDTASYRVGVDIGGTFTDLVLFDQRTGEYRTNKVSSTPPNYTTGVLGGLDDLTGGLEGLSFLVHGTTAGLNAFLQRGGASTALVTTRGFADVYEIGRASRPDMYNLFFRKPRPLVQRRHVFEIAGRVGYDGGVIQALVEQELAPLVDQLRDGDYAAVAVCLLHAYANPEHEQLVGEVLRRDLPGLAVTLSHEVAREWREYERTSTTVLNAYVTPIMETYLGTLEASLSERHFDSALHIMRSNGGVMTSAAARRQAVHTLFSGPVGAAIGAEALSRALGERNLICVDMGGTSFDVSLVLDGVAAQATEGALEGFPVLAPMVQVHSIGAGGGSIAWVEAGELRVGPRSAGADPGPACYGRGGREPTVTDANLHLGHIAAELFLGGAMPLDVQAASDALEPLTRPLGLDIDLLADGILRVANAKMANAIRAVTVARGIDPRDFTLVAIGGAGPMHAAALAKELEIERIVVPFSPGTFSAWGMLHADVRHDLASTFVHRTADTSAYDLEVVYARLKAEGDAILVTEGVPAEKRRFFRSADLRYVGQEYFLNVPANTGLHELVELFHRVYRERYGHSSPGAPVEFVNLRVHAVGLVDKGAAPTAPELTRQQSTPVSRRRAYFDGGWQDATIHLRSSLARGETVDGPAIVEEASCTTVVPPGFRATIDNLGNLVLASSPDGRPR